MAGALPEGIVVKPVFIEGLPEGLAAEWILPSSEYLEEKNRPLVLYTHGGGYVSGNCEDHRNFVAKIVKGTGIGALLYEYRLAPENPFPAGFDDSMLVYRWLLGQGSSPERLAIVGESAGGGLCLALLLAVRDAGLPLPACGVAMSPYTDLLLTGESHVTRRDACLSPYDMARVCSKYYYGDNDPKNPYISPLYGTLENLPPLHISVGDDETMRDDSIRFASKASDAGVDVTLRVEDGMVHCYPLMAPMFPEATRALEEICMFVQKHTGD
jgi:acetyl esterase/lipase